MQTSSSTRGPLIVLISGVILIIGGVIAMLVWGIASFNRPPAIATPIGPAPSIGLNDQRARLAVIDGDSLYTIDPDGSHSTSITTQGGLVLNALIWSRDNSRLIYAASEGNRGRLISVNADDSDSRVLVETDRARVPFYFYGSPDDQQIAFLQSDPATKDLRLMLAATSPVSEAALIALGRPDYFSWSPASDALLLHIGGTSSQAIISAYHLGDAAPHLIANDPAIFQAPAWSPIDQRWLYARNYFEGGQLIVADGVHETPVLTFPLGLAFSWSPDGQHIAYTQNDLIRATYNTLLIMDSAGHNAHMYFTGELIAFFWSPDSQRLAYLTAAFVEPSLTGRVGGVAAPRVDQQAKLNFAWHVIDLPTQRTINSIGFAPSPEFANLLNYFDQYAQSIELWSPDSRSLLFVGAPAQQARGVYVIDATQSNSAAQFIGPGQFATWSWK
jgi:TolB protein